MKQFTSEKQKMGQAGEDIACRFFIKHGFIIKERNFTRKYGEIDIIAEKNKKLHFIEVKSVSKSLDKKFDDREKEKVDNFQPEDNMHPWKLKRLSRVIQVYLLGNSSVDGQEDQEWQLDIALVFLDLQKKIARVRIIEDIVL